MKFENTEVWGFEHALRGMRNPKNRWNKSASFFGIVDIETDQPFDESAQVAAKWCPVDCDDKKFDTYNNKLLQNGTLQTDEHYANVAFIGPNDMKLAQTLIKAGPEHRKFLRQIFVSVDITAPSGYFFPEFDTYKIGTTANSTSKMHKLTSKEITLKCFETDDFNPDLEYYKGNTVGMLSDLIIEQLEFLRQKYLETKDKKYWKELVRWLPCGWLQTRTWSANYEVIRSMCHQRRNHKLNEWSGMDDNSKSNFIAWARTLPYAQWFIFDDENVSFEITETENN